MMPLEVERRQSVSMVKVLLILSSFTDVNIEVSPEALGTGPVPRVMRSY